MHDRLPTTRRASHPSGVRAFDAVVFDLDGTLMLGNSITDTVQVLGGASAELAALICECRARTVDHTTAEVRLYALLTSRGQVSRPRLQMLFAKASLRPGARELVSKLRDAGHQVGLISSSFDLFASVTAGRLGVGDHYSNVRLDFDSSDTLVGVGLTIWAAELKNRQLRHFCQVHQLDPARVVAVGDNDNDLAMFAGAGNGVLLSGPYNHHLRNHARQVVADLDELADLLLSDAHNGRARRRCR
jgi:HAD superfamily phosphoserine phosphatase-like hydrolase